VLEEVRIAFEVLERHVQHTIWDSRSGSDLKKAPMRIGFQHKAAAHDAGHRPEGSAASRQISI
jgi:hypothetical protein